MYLQLSIDQRITVYPALRLDVAPTPRIKVRGEYFSLSKMSPVNHEKQKTINVIK